MNALLDIYRAQMKRWFAVQLQYRAALLIWLIGLVLDPVLYLVVWSTVAGQGEVGGFDRAGFAAYFIATMIVNHLTFTWHMWEYDYRIRHGEMSILLLRPVHPIHEDISDNVTYKIITVVVVVPITAALVLLFRPAWDPAGWAVLAFIPALFLAFAIQFFCGWALAMAAFWTSRVAAINQMWFVGKLFLAGQLAPLSLLPPAAQVAATILPYRWILSFPVELLLGRLSPAETAAGFAAQLAWLLLSLALVRVAWRAGVRRYEAFGA
ncbi:MAG: ABC-2 family transporter protein [Chloroflexi bacterium]|nr:ABC-2 family transporter protein [Chloroflexota bacterium]MCI0576188.1 ABC-2 family transporter protein [Chloroflexota bacterium]MCI0645518.1 ABC-2 family transporter protein [Chloroflexota bacterium]MCI0730657.1 ABC-2 family transporter protein [Chloroflexota bacterium]